MKRIAPLILFVVCTFYSCEILDPCRNLDCATNNYYGQFRIVNDADGSDLVFGATAIYDKTKIQFYSLNDADTSFYEYKTIKFPDTGYDSILYVRFYPYPNTAVYLKLNDSDVDTLKLNYETSSSKCCGTITQIKNFRYNNSVDIRGDAGTQEIRKKL